MIRLIIKGVTHPDWFIIDSKQAVYELKELMIAHGPVLETLFSGNKERMMVKVERELKKEIFGQFPEYQGNAKWEIAISIMICGCFYAFLSHSADDPDEVTEIIGNLNQIMIEYLKEEERT